MPETPEGLESGEKSHHLHLPHHDKKVKEKKRKSVRIHDVKEKIKDKIEKAAEEIGHHHSRHNSAEQPQDINIERVEPAVVQTAPVVESKDKPEKKEKKEKKEKRHSSRMTSGLFKPSVVDTEMPKTLAKHPSVKLTDSLIDKIFEAWDQFAPNERPAPHLVERLHAGLKPVFSQHLELANDKDKLLDVLRIAADQLKEQVDQHEGERAEYKVDVDLSNTKALLQKQVTEYDALYANAMDDYNAEKQRLETRIQDIDQKKTDITAEAVLEKLKTLTVYQELHQKIIETIRAKQDLLENRTCTQKLFFCFPGKEQKQLAVEMGRLEAQRMMLGGGSLDEIRQALLNELEKEREETREKLNILIKAQPKYENIANSDYLSIEAKVSADRLEYYYRVDALVMFALIRVVMLLDKISKVLPRPSLVESSEALTDDASKQPTKADPFLCRLVDNLRDRLRQRVEAFYCATPGRYSYQDYQTNVKSLDKTQQRDIMLGTALPETIQAVIPEYPASSEPTMRAKMG